MNEHKNDFYYKQAKEQGYRARSAFKLNQMDNKYHFLKPGIKVLDIGAAPGGWLQIVSEKIGDKGTVIGVDIVEIKPLGLSNVKTIRGNILEEETQNKIESLVGKKLDVVISDIAPSVSGNWDIDQYNQLMLARMSMFIAKKLLIQKGWFITKVFQGRDYDDFLGEVKSSFKSVKVFKPSASRKSSAEIYFIAQGLK
jgi:23S rRNA (uridine2552-2'-O)-methyltransferase